MNEINNASRERMKEALSLLLEKEGEEGAEQETGVCSVVRESALKRFLGCGEMGLRHIGRLIAAAVALIILIGGIVIGTVSIRERDNKRIRENSFEYERIAYGIDTEDFAKLQGRAFIVPPSGFCLEDEISDDYFYYAKYADDAQNIFIFWLRMRRETDCAAEEKSTGTRVAYRDISGYSFSEKGAKRIKACYGDYYIELYGTGLSEEDIKNALLSLNAGK